MKESLIHRLTSACILIASLAALSGCGGGNNPGPPQHYTVGGSVTGLASGESVGLLDDNGNPLTVSADGTFVFTSALAGGVPYAVTVGTQPVGQTCSVSGGLGTVGTADVTSVVVSCSNDTYTIGGTIRGLSDSGLVLANGTDTLKVAANGTSFTMPTAVTNGTAYDVTVQANPPALSCTVASGAGTVPAADVTGISVSCVPGTESLLYSFQGGTTDGNKPYGNLIQAGDGNFYGMTADGGANGDGAVFKITPGGTETVLYSFKGGATDGFGPQGSLIQASDGNFYGMTGRGGASSGSGNGVVFKVAPGGSETVLHVFKGGTTDGSAPDGSLIQASDGNFYGMTVYGGASDHGVVFKISPGGSETVLYSFKGGTTDGFGPLGSLIQASDGNFYGMTQHGGASSNGVVFKITSGGSETVLYSFKGGTTDGTQPYGSLIQASDGNFYGMTYYGGASDDGVVFKITPGGTETVLYSFRGGTADGFGPHGRLIQASDGNFYGMTQYGGASDDGVVFKITPGGAETVLYSFQGGTTDGGNPMGSLIQAGDGTLYGMTRSYGASSDGTVFEFN